MFDVFTEEIEVQIKSGLSNLYWYRRDLMKAWLRSGVTRNICDSIERMKKPNGEKISKREMMDELYLDLRKMDYNRRLEISRNFVRILIEHKNFVPQSKDHRVEIAERCSLKLREIIKQQQKEAEYRDQIRRKAFEAKKEDYHSQLPELRDRFSEIYKLNPQKRGFELEKTFANLMRISGIPVQDPFRIEGEQIDGAIKYDSHYYLVELKWIDNKVGQAEIASLFMKVEGKSEARGIFIAMNGYSNEVLKSLPKGKELKIILLDGNHISNVIFGIYTFQELMEHALWQVSFMGELYCSHEITK